MIKAKLNGFDVEVSNRPVLEIEEIVQSNGSFILGKRHWLPLEISNNGFPLLEPTILEHEQSRWSLTGLSLTNGFLSFENAICLA